MNVVPIPDAARALGISPATLRRWIRRGCPVAVRGRRGRGLAALVDPVAVRAWRLAGEREATLMALASALPDVLAQSVADAFAQTSQSCSTGGERRRVASALAACWYVTATALMDHLRDQCPAVPDLTRLPERIEALRKIATC